MKWQVELANKYKVYGFCFYHYWFSGKKLLEKPVEMFLENKELKTNYCLCWANEHWTNTWANGNSKMYHTEDMQSCIQRAGLSVETIHDHLGLGHSILVVKR